MKNVVSINPFPAYLPAKIWIMSGVPLRASVFMADGSFFRADTFPLVSEAQRTVR